MSQVVIRSQLEEALYAMAGGVRLVAENESYMPVVGTPYQEMKILWGRTRNPTLGDGFYRETGFLQVTLKYPPKTGPGDADAQAELIRAAFPNGRSFVTGKVETFVDGTPSKLPSDTQEDRFVVPVRIPFYANVYP